ncbi:MAG TPA: hypothetical protein VFC76_00060 [Oscillospiraceae bacterium]|nr:hypothetical protein [Oscillospiraceae bacterium]
MQHKTVIMKYFEVVFDSFYLIVGYVIFVIQLYFAQTLSGFIASFMMLILIFGDSFHLIPRIHMLISGKKPFYALGFGKLVTSVTMTVFYVLFWFWGLVLFKLPFLQAGTYIIVGLAVIRIVLCFLPQNRWFEKSGSFKFGVIRNIPFVLLGFLVMLMFLLNRAYIPSLYFIWLAVLLSFVFYIPVVLFSGKSPKWGMLMLPKTLMYMWIIVMLLKGPQ